MGEFQRRQLAAISAALEETMQNFPNWSLVRDKCFGVANAIDDKIKEDEDVSKG